jgi:acyl carrier protein
MRDQAITTVFLLSSVLTRLPVEDLPALRTIITGGECFSSDLVTRWTHNRRFFYVYGPTEATIFQSFRDCTETCLQKPPIGRPIANIQFYLLDRHLQPVPIGATGELYIGGVGPARGYLNRSDLTAEKFIPNPFSREPETRLYKTGDLARYLLDGNIEFLGRIDHQLKIRGFRIELGEIEAVLTQHPDVREAVVMAREDVPGDKRLVAYVVPVQELIPTVGGLRRFLKQKLPEYMVPSAFIRLDALPLTPNKKVNRQLLPSPDQARPNLEEIFVDPRTPVEELLAGIWAEVLRLERVGIHDNFFELGGHSLLATQVISRMREVFQVEPPLSALFETPTVAGLALAVTQNHFEHKNSYINRIIRQAPEEMLTNISRFSEAEIDSLIENLLT